VSDSFQLDGPDHFTAGAIGPPGQRVFYLQAREGARVVTLKCEKEQVAALGEYLGGLLARLTGAPTPPADKRELLQPIEAAWPVGSLGVGYDGDRDRIVVVANERLETEEEQDEVEEESVEATRASEGEPDAESEAASARFVITRAQAAAFVERARALLKAGRPTCPMCGEPRDPAGHTCPRSNGHVVPKA
jgi:uncharacterized repeat protein (TIGR03847 family)